MTLKNKILIILSLCLLLCIGAYFIISRTFANFEKQLFEKCRIEALVGGRVMSEIIDMMIDTRLLTNSRSLTAIMFPFKEAILRNSELSMMLSLTNIFKKLKMNF